MLYNLIVSLSNLYGLRIFTLNLNKWQKLFFSSIIGSSILMHLSERKHSLPGIYPFNKYSNLFLWFDRIMAILGLSYVMLNMNNNLFRDVVFEGLCGLALLGISENFNKIGKIGFLITHSFWHVIAYDVIYKVIKY